jgi:hypothetical protein
MKIYVFDQVFENFDIKDPLDLEFLNNIEGKIIRNLSINQVVLLFQHLQTFYCIK